MGSSQPSSNVIELPSALMSRRPAAAPRRVEIVTRSPRMREVLGLIDKVAPTNVTVLFLGETGTGKTLLARALHERSRRAQGPLQEVHCTALPQQLLESELFGHERGAFTGAQKQHTGHLEMAHGGTLFLDEIGDVPLPIQVKLLRFLQDRSLCPVGGTSVRTVDVRFVLATNCDLPRAVAERRVREDLYYRIATFPIEVPPLRSRTEDIPLLAAQILGRHGDDLRLSDEALDQLLRHPWPGNVRELENVLERAAILAGLSEGAETGPIERRHLPPGLGSASDPALPDLLRLGFSLDRHVADLLQAALTRTGGNKARAARLLGITRRRVYSMLHGPTPPVEGELDYSLPP